MRTGASGHIGANLVRALRPHAETAANAFEAVVDVPNWRAPGDLRAYRQFIQARHAGHFYRVLSPITIAVLLSALVCSWRAGLPLWPLVAVSLVASVGAEGLTVAYFFPRNETLFFSEPLPSEGLGVRLLAQWGAANVLRLAIVSAGLFAGLSVLLLPRLIPISAG